VPDASTPDSLIGKKIGKIPEGPEDSARFQIRLLTDRTVEVIGEGTVSVATGIAYLKHGTWKLEDNVLILGLVFTGTLSEPQGDGYAQTEKTLRLDYRLITDDLLRSTENVFMLP